MRVLERGLEGLNQAKVGAGLQVFYNLGDLKATVDGLISKYKSQGVKSVSVALDMKAISAWSGGGYGPRGIQRSGTPQIERGGKAKEAPGENEYQMDQLHSIGCGLAFAEGSFKEERPADMLLLDEIMQVSE
ncbi:Conserved oligomeric Golgi complex subunit 5 [Camellia lanceoleosa]|nr:Conserved oligomeric Golgi complex subunit 5 [Camellia lanceoleosa]